MNVRTLPPLMGPLTIATATYEYRGDVVLPENDTLTWIDEELEKKREREKNGPRRCLDITD